MKFNKHARNLLLATCLALAVTQPARASTVTWNTDTASAFDVTIDGYLDTDHDLSSDAYISTELWPGDFSSPAGLWKFTSTATRMLVLPPGPLEVEPFIMCAIASIGVEFLGGSDWFGGTAGGYGLGSSPSGSNPFLFGGPGSESWTGLATFQFLEIGNVYDFSTYHFQFHLFGSGPVREIGQGGQGEVSVPDTGLTAMFLLMPLLLAVAGARRLRALRA